MNYKEVLLTMKRKSISPNHTNKCIRNIMCLLNAKLKHETETETYQLHNKKKIEIQRRRPKFTLKKVNHLSDSNN